MNAVKIALIALAVAIGFLCGEMAMYEWKFKSGFRAVPADQPAGEMVAALTVADQRRETFVRLGELPRTGPRPLVI